MKLKPDGIDAVLDVIAALGAVVLVFAAALYVWVTVTRAGRTAYGVSKEPPESYLARLVIIFCLLSVPAGAVEVQVRNNATATACLTNGTSIWAVPPGTRAQIDLDSGTYGVMVLGQTGGCPTVTFPTNQDTATLVQIWTDGAALAVETSPLPSTLGNYTKGFTLGAIIFGTLWLIRMAAQAGKEQVDP